MLSESSLLIETLELNESDRQYIYFDEFRRLMCLVEDKGWIYQPRFKTDEYQDTLYLIGSMLLENYHPLRNDMVIHASYLLECEPTVLKAYKDYECGIDTNLVDELSQLIEYSGNINCPRYDAKFERLHLSIYDDISLRLAKGCEFISDLNLSEVQRISCVVEDFDEPLWIYDDPMEIRDLLRQRVEERRLKNYGPFVKSTRDGDVMVFDITEPKIVIPDDIMFSYRSPPGTYGASMLVNEVN
ncbi:MAG: hypothetical protein K0B02_04620 [DPANN group archaeon]|nr:hypothetical protein [DPANN group archaeon]